MAEEAGNVLLETLRCDIRWKTMISTDHVARERRYGQNLLVTRKGAVRARLGDMGIIPGSMGARSYIVRGKGNRDSFDSCSRWNWIGTPPIRNRPQ